MTINNADFAGPNISMLLITVHVIPAPITPPKRTYLGDTFAKAEIESLPVTNQAPMQTAKAVSCTQPLETHIPVVFVTELSTGRIADSICAATDAQKRTLHSVANISRDEAEEGATYLTLMRQNLTVLKEALGTA